MTILFVLCEVYECVYKVKGLAVLGTGLMLKASMTILFVLYRVYECIYKLLNRTTYVIIL